MRIFSLVGAGGILLAPTRSRGVTHRMIARSHSTHALRFPTPYIKITETSKRSLLFLLVGAGGIEPSTVGLKGHCSTD